MNNPIANVSELRDKTILLKYMIAGCMECIVHYKEKLLNGYEREVDCERLIKECDEYLGRLRRIDGMRRGRYEAGLSIS